MPLGIIDTHTHFYDPTRPQGVPWPPKGEKVLYRTVLPADFQALAKPLGSTGTVVVEASPWLEDNQWVLDLAKDDPFLLGLVGNLDLGAPSFRENLMRFARNELFLGIRINAQMLAKGIGEAAFLDHLRRLAGLNRELDLVGDAGMLLNVVRLTRQVPALRIVLDHLPLDPPADEAKRKAADQAFDELQNHPRVFAKVSNVLRKVEGKVVTDVAFYRERLDRIWHVFGAQRVVYGSNWPVSDKVAPYEDILTVVQEYVRLYQPESKERYFRENARRAYAWPEREHK